jgi:hypothetical protein
MFIRQVGLVMRKLREELTLQGLRKGIEDSTINGISRASCTQADLPSLIYAMNSSRRMKR